MQPFELLSSAQLWEGPYFDSIAQLGRQQIRLERNSKVVNFRQVLFLNFCHDLCNVKLLVSFFLCVEILLEYFVLFR